MQGVQHGVAEGNLFLPHGPPVLRKQIPENPFHLPVHLLRGSLVIHNVLHPHGRQTDAAWFFLHAARIRRLWRPSEFFERVCCLHCITSAQKAMRAGLRFQAVHWLPRGLADSNPRPANPSDVWANDGAYHDPPPGVVAKGEPPLFPVKRNRSAPKAQAAFQKGKRLCFGASSRFFRRRSSGRERTRMAVFSFQGSEKASFLPFH